MPLISHVRDAEHAEETDQDERCDDAITDKAFSHILAQTFPWVFRVKLHGFLLVNSGVEVGTDCTGILDPVCPFLSAPQFCVETSDGAEAVFFSVGHGVGYLVYDNLVAVDVFASHGTARAGSTRIAAFILSYSLHTYLAVEITRPVRSK